MSVYAFGPFHLDSEHLLLTHGTEPVGLGPKVVETLLALVEHRGETVSKAALLERVWPEGYIDEANLAQNVYVLRKTLRAYWDAETIATAPRRGYRFVAPMTCVERAPVEPPAVVRDRRSRRRAVSAAIAAAFAAVLLGGAVFGVSRAHHDTSALSPNGERLYEIGNYYWNQRTAVGLRKSLAYFEQVIRTEPRNARGYAAMAAANAIMGDYEFGPLPPNTYYNRARAYARRALALDARSAAAYAVLGMLRDLHGPQRGVPLLRRAIALDPRYGPAHQWLGTALLRQGLPHQALRELQIAAQLDPLSVATTDWLSSAAYLDRHYADAIAYGNQTLDLAPKRFDVLAVIGMAYEQRGQYSDAIATLERFSRACEACDAEGAALLADVYAVEHRSALARKEIARAQARPHHVPVADVAIALAAMGDTRDALAWLSRLKGGANFAFYWLDPRFDALRRDARFRSIMRSRA